MAGAFFRGRIFRLSVLYLQERQRGPHFYYRRIPQDVLSRYDGKRFIRESLKTRSLEEAAKLILLKAARDDALWKAWRDAGDALDPEVTTDARHLVASWGKRPGDGKKIADWHEEPHEDYLEQKYGHNYMKLRWQTEPKVYADQRIEDLLNPIENEALRLLFKGELPQSHLLSDAMRVYLAEHPKGAEPKFAADTQRVVFKVVEIVGDLTLPTYTRAHAIAVRNKLMEKHSTGTVSRRLSVVQAVITKGLREFGLPDVNNFRSLEIPGEGKDAKKVEPFTAKELRALADACVVCDDDIRHIAAIQLDTGARLGEVVGLRREDVFLTAPVPYLWFRFREDLKRTLKTTNSQRSVPLVGMALWAAQRALESPSDGWLFPRYIKSETVKNTVASAAVNKWIRKVTGGTKGSHSFRHAMKDRLRDADVRGEVSEAIMGHGPKSISKGYGAGYTVDFLRQSLMKVAMEPDSIKTAKT